MTFKKDNRVELIAAGHSIALGTKVALNKTSMETGAFSVFFPIAYALPPIFTTFSLAKDTIQTLFFLFRVTLRTNIQCFIQKWGNIF